MHYQRIIDAFYGSAWAILPEKFEALRAFLACKAEGGDVSEEEIRRAIASRSELPEIGGAVRRNNGVVTLGRTAVMPIFGILSRRVDMLERASGGISTEEIGATLDELMADKSIRNIVMVINSPGGSVAGIPELAQQIRESRDTKKIIGLADPLAASAGFWLLAQTSEAYVLESGQVGSVGVISAHYDVSKAEEMMGLKTTIVTSSKYKAEFASQAPLSEDARAEMESKVMEFHEMFVSDLAKGRGVSTTRVEKDFGQGRMFTGAAAVRAGLVDRVGDLKAVLKRLGATGAGSDGPGAVAEVLAVEAEADNLAALDAELKTKAEVCETCGEAATESVCDVREIEPTPPNDKGEQFARFESAGVHHFCEAHKRPVIRWARRKEEPRRTTAAQAACIAKAAEIRAKELGAA